MKKAIFSAAVFALASGNPAWAQSAADWSGPYAGLSLGAILGHAKWTATSTSDIAGTAIVDASSPANYDPTGVRFGLHGGYDWRLGRWVLGPEAEFAISDATENKAGFPGCAIDCAGAPGPGIDKTSLAMRWDASLRGRVGYLVADDLLVYGTGGVAFQQIRTSGTCEGSLADPLCLVEPGAPLHTDTHDTTLTGGTFGAGVEWNVCGNWRLRGEYRYSFYGRWRDVFFAGLPTVAPGSDTYRYTVEPDTQILSVGASYAL